MFLHNARSSVSQRVAQFNAYNECGYSSSRFGRQTNSNRPPTGPQNGQPPASLLLSPTYSENSQNPSSATTLPSLNSTLGPASTSNTDTLMTDDNMVTRPMASPTRRVPFFFREENSSLIAKGNFMTLAAKPEHVEKGEWLAHQIVEQYRLLAELLRVIQEQDSKTGVALCNPTTCPTMCAGEYVYTWLDSNKNSVRIPAAQYISLVQKWIFNKINDPKIFPTDTTFQSSATYASGGTNTPGSATPIPAGPTNLNQSLSSLAGRDWLGKSSGFQENFESDIRNLYRQMCRCYSHLYYNHWLDPFWHVGAHKELNTCYIHFITVGKLFGLLVEKDMRPMQPLLDIWSAKGLLPASVAESNTETIQPHAEPTSGGQT